VLRESTGHVERGALIVAIEIRRAACDDAAGIVRLLEESRLPTAGAADHLATMVVAERGDRIVGSAGLEIYADGALLRSVAVAPELQGTGLGRDLTERAIQLARELKMPAIYLLTTTAAKYFPKFGFEEISRGEVPRVVQSSVEFTSACPSSATVMRKPL
jgi:amino-acid N-acetyltransferase